MSLLEIKLKNDSDFLKIRETLTRMGVASNSEKTLCQSCYILSKRGKFYVCTLDELRRMDGLSPESSNMNEDIIRRNGIAKCLEEWDLCEIVDPDKHEFSEDQNFRIISYSAKKDWKLITEYQFS